MTMSPLTPLRSEPEAGEHKWNTGHEVVTELPSPLGARIVFGPRAGGPVTAPG